MREKSKWFPWFNPSLNAAQVQDLLCHRLHKDFQFI